MNNQEQNDMIYALTCHLDGLLAWMQKHDPVAYENSPDARVCADKAARYLKLQSSQKKTTIIAVDKAGACKTGNLSDILAPEDIQAVLGFPANVKDDPYKVKHSWGFAVDGAECGIWDYKGSRWSVYDPKGKLPALFAAILAQKGAA